MTLCESFLSIPLDWALFKHFFYIKPQMVSKDVYQTCGALGIQAKRPSSYFDMKWPDSLKWWTSTRFYCMEPLTDTGAAALQLYSLALAKWNQS